MQAVRRDLDAGADRRDRGEDDVVAVAPDEGVEVDELAVVGGVVLEIRPPHRTDEDQRAERQHDERRRVAVRLERRLDRRAGGEDALAEDDDREQPVALHDVRAVPWRPAAAALRPHRHAELERDQGHERRPGHRGRHPEPRHPSQLGHRHPDREAQRGRAPGRILGGRAQPLGDEANPHHDVADRDRQVVELREGARDARGDDEDAGDLDEGQEPIGDVIGVVRAREPGEVHPCPPDGEEDHQERDDAFQEVAVGELVVERHPGLSHGDDEAQVDEQLERGRRAVRLIRVATAHRSVEGGCPERHRWITRPQPRRASEL